MASCMRTVLVLAAILAVWVPPARADDRIEIFDTHLHYNWEPTAFYSLEQVLALFRQHRLAQLPPGITNGIAHANAKRLFGGS